ARRGPGGAGGWARAPAVQAGTGGRASAARAGGGDEGKCRLPDEPPEASAPAGARGLLPGRHDLPGWAHAALLSDGGPTDRSLPAPYGAAGAPESDDALIPCRH